MSNEKQPVESMLLNLIDEFINGKMTLISLSSNRKLKTVSIDLMQISPAMTSLWTNDHFKNRGIALFKMLMEFAIDKKLVCYSKTDWRNSYTFVFDESETVDKIDKFRKNM